MLDKVRVFATLAEAIADLSLVYATTARRRDLQKDVSRPRGRRPRTSIGHIAGGAGAGMLFGRERWGLYNDEVAVADAIVTLPGRAGLRLAQHRAGGAADVATSGGARARATTLPFTEPPESPPATKDELLGLFEHLEGVLDTTGFFTSADKRPSMVNNLRDHADPRHG